MLSAQVGFLDVTLGNILTLAVTILGVFIAYRKLQSDQTAQREDYLKEQTKMHAENSAKLDKLSEFHQDQLELNEMRDRQIAEMQRQTAVLEEIARGINRRLEMLEQRKAWPRS